MKTSGKFSRAIEAALKEYGFRRVTASAATPTRGFETSDRYDQPIGSRAHDRTLPAYKAKNLNEICWQAYKKNPILFGIVELNVRSTAGKQIAIRHNKLEDQSAVVRGYAERINKLLKARWWNAPRNNWPTLAENIQRDMTIFGELIPVPMTSTLTGDVEMGFLDVNTIKEIVRDKMNTRRVIGIKVLLDGGVERTLQLVKQYDGQKLYTDGKPPEWFASWERVAPEKLKGRLIGECFYWSANVTLSGVRGQGDFAQVIDPAQDAVKIIKGLADQIQINNRVWSEIVFPDNTSQKEINAAFNPSDEENYINPPSMSDDGDDVRVFGHSKQIEWNFKSPNIASTEKIEAFKASLALVSSGSNIAVYRLGMADALTYASAKEVDKGTVDYLRDRQGALRSYLTQATNFQLDQWRMFSSELDGIPEELIYDYSFDMPKIDDRTLEQNMAAMTAKMNVITGAKLNNTINEEQAQRLTHGVMREGGLSE